MWMEMVLTTLWSAELHQTPPRFFFNSKMVLSFKRIYTIKLLPIATRMRAYYCLMQTGIIIRIFILQAAGFARKPVISFTRTDCTSMMVKETFYWIQQHCPKITPANFV